MMSLPFSRISYSDLNARQKEDYNFLKVSECLSTMAFSR